MKYKTLILIYLLPLILISDTISAQHPAFDNNPFFFRNDPELYNPGQNAHGGPGVLDYMELTPRDAFKSNFIFLHRGVMHPKSGIGEHAHRQMEEMYFVLDHYGEFTVNGRTAEIPAIGMALCPKGSSHGIYNPTDHVVEWMNWGISDNNRQYDAVNFNTEGSDLIDQPIESPPPFKWAVLHTALLDPVTQLLGGKGTVYIRDVWDSEDFGTNQEYLRHYLVPPGCSIGLHRHDVMEVVWYVISGTGRGTINKATYDLIPGDTMSCTLTNAIGIYNNGTEDLEIMAVGVSLEKGVTDAIPLDDDLIGR